MGAGCAKIPLSCWWKSTCTIHSRPIDRAGGGGGVGLRRLACHLIGPIICKTVRYLYFVRRL